MKATMLLCDAAQVDPAGKVHILGAGWTVVAAGPGAPVPGHAVVAIVHVPWNETNQPHRVQLRLEDADGRPVLIGPPQASVPMIHNQVIEVGRPPRAPEGISIDVPVVVAVGPGLGLAAGRYAWRLEIDDEGDEDWVVAFHVRAAG